MAVQMLGIKTKFTDDQGRPLVGGKVHAYFAGTTTYQDTFKDPDMTIVNTNPIILDDSGSADVYLNGSYRIRIFDKNDVLIEEQDGVTQSASGEITTAKGEIIGLYGAVLNSLTNEVKRAVAAEKTIADSLTSETTRAKSAESALQSSIDAEAIRAKKAESDLNTGLAKEVSDRKLEVTRLDEADAVLQAQINSVGGGKLAYKTYAEMIADKSNIAAKSSIDIIADTDDKNGTYLYDGTNFVKSKYDLEKIIRAKVQNTFGTYAQMIASNLSDGSYALVADDTADNFGLYIKEGGAWRKSKFYSGYADEVKEYVDYKLDSIDTECDTSCDGIVSSMKLLEDQLQGASNGVVIDVEIEDGYNVLVSNEGKKDFYTLEEYLGDIFKFPKIVMNKQGEYEYSPHNLVSSTDSLDTAWAKVRCEVSRVVPSTFKMVNTGTASPSLWLSALDVDATKLVTITAGFKIKPIVDTNFVLFTVAEKTVVFNLTDSTVEDLGGAISADIVLDTGTGFFGVVVTANLIRASSETRKVSFVLSDNKTRIPSKKGSTAIIKEVQVNAGGYLQKYLPTPVGGRVSLPSYDYTHGTRSVVIEPNLRNYYGSWSCDFTKSVWVKDGIVATFDAVSPVGSICSKLKATKQNATVFQTIYRDVASMTMLIRRVSGSGSVSVTLDGGVIWSDVTDDVGNKFKQVSVAGFGKDVGIKLGSTNDEVEVCFFNSFIPADSSTPRALQPMPVGDAQYDVYSSDVQFTSNTPKLKNLLSYVKSGVVSHGDISKAKISPILIKSANDKGKVTLGPKSLLYWNSENKYLTTPLGETKYINNYVLNYENKTGRLNLNISSEVTTKENAMAVDFFNSIYMPHTEHLSLYKAVLIDKEADSSEVASFRRKAIGESGVVKEIVSITPFASIAGTNLMREPTLCVLKDSNDEVDLLVMHMNRRDGGYHSEAPARLLQRIVRFNRLSAEFTYLTDTQVAFEHDGWKQGKGHNQSPCVMRIKHGVNKGKLICLFTKSDGDELSPRHIYRMFNDNNGDAESWTTPEKVISNLGNDMIGAPDGSIVTLPSNHPTAPNRIVTATYDGAYIYCICSDDSGITWNISSRINHTDLGMSKTFSEPSLCLLPNGRLLIDARTQSLEQGVRARLTSSDGGETWQPVADVLYDQIPDVGGSLVQLDPTGKNSPNGEVYISVPNRTNTRKGVSLYELSEDLQSNISRKQIVPLTVGASYSSSVPVLGNKYIAVAYEGNTRGFNADSSTYLIIVDPRA